MRHTPLAGRLGGGTQNRKGSGPDIDRKPWPKETAEVLRVLQRPTKVCRIQADHDILFDAIQQIGSKETCHVSVHFEASA